MGSLYFRSHGSCELLASWHGKRLISMPLTWLLSPPLTQASRLLFAWARPPTVSPTELTDDANADYFFFPPSFFAVITVILHGWRCTSTGSILTADSFFYLNEKKKSWFAYFIQIGMIFAAVRSSFLTGPIEIQSLRLAILNQNQRRRRCFWA